MPSGVLPLAFHACCLGEHRKLLSTACHRRGVLLSARPRVSRGRYLRGWESKWGWHACPLLQHGPIVTRYAVLVERVASPSDLCAKGLLVRTPQTRTSDILRRPGKIDHFRSEALGADHLARAGGALPLGEEHGLSVSPRECSVGKGVGEQGRSWFARGRPAANSVRWPLQNPGQAAGLGAARGGVDRWFEGDRLDARKTYDVAGRACRAPD
jgi:hypothetical protein